MILSHATDTTINGDYDSTLITAKDAKLKDNKLRAGNIPLRKNRYICPICHVPLFPKQIGDTYFFSCYDGELHTDDECAKPGTVGHEPTPDGILQLFNNMFSVVAKVEKPPSNGSEADILDNQVPLVISDNDDDNTESINAGASDLSGIIPLIDNIDNTNSKAIPPKIQPLTTLKQIRTDLMPIYSASYVLHGIIIHSFAVYGDRTYRLFFGDRGIYQNGNRVFCAQFEYSTSKRTRRKNATLLLLFQVFWRNSDGTYSYKRLALITNTNPEFKKIKKKFVKEVLNEIGTSDEVLKENKQYGLIGGNWQSLTLDACSKLCPKCDHAGKNYYCGKCKGLLIAPLLSSRQVEKIKLPRFNADADKK